jgi:glutaredoxin 2
MKLEFYHYVHCPYCIRVRLALGLLGLAWTSVVIPYDDEVTPVKLCGKKMLPILVVDGRPMNESLDIIRFLDREDRLRTSQLPLGIDFEAMVQKFAENVHNLAMPWWVWTPEFDERARAYFTAKKEAKRGPFSALVRRRGEFEAPLLTDLAVLTPRLRPFWDSDVPTIHDIVLTAQLWGLFHVPEFRFPAEWHDYLMRMKDACRFVPHQDHWGKA